MRNILPYRLTLILILLMTVLPGHTQINSFSDQYLGNLFLINPAIAGTGQYGNLSFTSRQQWVGWEGAPASQSVTYHTKWARSKNRFNPFGFINKGKNTFSNVGVGAGFFHESRGVFQLTGIHLDYSYHVYARKGRLSFGLSPSVFQLGSSTLVLADPNDPYLANPVRSYFVDMNAGIHYFNKQGYAGFSIIQLFNSSVKLGNYGFMELEYPSLNPDLARSAYAYGGYFFDLNRSRNLRIEPMAVVKLNSASKFRFDLSTTIHLLDKFHAGVSCSWKKGLSVYTGVRLDNFYFRYLFELPVSADLPNRFSSHMIQLSINLGQPIE